MQGIYAIHDTLADAIFGGLHLFKGDAPAVRFFSDVATLPDSQVGKHIDDYRLIRIGMVNDDGTLLTDFAVILTGSAWAAAQQPEADNAGS